MRDAQLYPSGVLWLSRPSPRASRWARRAKT